MSDTDNISDGYHTFGELYAHRIELFLALGRILQHVEWGPYLGLVAWKARLHFDGTAIPGWFIAGIDIKRDKQITYHLPEEVWHRTDGFKELPRAPEFDGHTSQDVLERLRRL